MIVSTPDHHHALASVAAMKRGKHVYCEKPLAHSVHEARIVRETYNKTKVATQMGTQIHATDNYRRVVEMIQSGVIGAVKEAHVWCNRVGFPPGRTRPTDTLPVPKQSTGTCGSAPAPAPLSSQLFSAAAWPGNSGGISAMAAWATWAVT